MKKVAIFLLIILFGWGNKANAQYTFDDNRTAEQLIERLQKDNVTIINPELNCIDAANGTYEGEGVYFIDTGIVLSTASVYNLFNMGPMNQLSTNKDTLQDEDINAIYRSWGTDTLLRGFLTCKLTFDMIPHTDTIKIDYSVSEPGMGPPYYFAFGGYYIRPGCRPTADMFAILVSGGGEGYHKKNFAVIPGTEMPVNVYSLHSAFAIDDVSNCREGAMSGWESAPYLEYYCFYPDCFDTSTIDYNVRKTFSSSIKMEAVIPTTPCDTYSVKLAVAKNMFYLTEYDYPSGTKPPGYLEKIFRGGGDVFFLGNLRGVGSTIEECFPTEDTTTSIGIQPEYTALNIYPNPASTSIQVDVSKVKYSSGSLVIYDILGKQVYTESLYAKKDMLQVSVKDFPSGVYTLLFHTDRGNYKGKFRVE